jgi:hypothetical protein
MQRKRELRSAGLSNSTSDPNPAPVEDTRKQGKVLGKRTYKTREQASKQASQVIRIDLAQAKQ